MQVNISRLGTFLKTADKTASPGELPNLLNKDPGLYGVPTKEIDLKKGSDGFQDEGYGDLYDSFFDYIKKTSRKEIPLKKATTNLHISGNRLISKRFVKTESYFYVPHDEYEQPSNKEASKAVLRAVLNREDGQEVRVLYAADMDAIDEEGKFVEIVSSKCPYKLWLKKQSLHYYMQSYLGNVDYIVRGQIDKDNIVQRDHLKNDEDALMIRIRGRDISYDFENPANCNFVDQRFLDFFDTA
uniref:Decapping nuclease n=1 Tax=Caenorhabditis tropicalis TaxID=1561998 RepID=A0A1I7T2R6_9PELO